MKLVLFDQHASGLYPLSLTRPCADIRLGILTLAEKWSARGHDVRFKTSEYLSELYPDDGSSADRYVDGRVIYSDQIAQAVEKLKQGQGLFSAEHLIACHVDEFSLEKANQLERIELEEVEILTRPYDVFRWADREIRADFDIITEGRTSAGLSADNQLIGKNIFIEEGAQIQAAVLNSTNGPIYIGKNAEIMEGSLIRGPFSLGEASVVKMGAKIYGATSIGPQCKVGGELNNVCMQSHSNKGHDGFLGNAAIGQWCNLGADTNCSNLKNNYADVKVWDYSVDRFTPSGLQFCGLIMGDHSKCGINTMFNTGTLVGVSANIFGAGFPRNFVPSFSWGGSAGFSTYALKKSVETAARVMKRRGVDFSASEQKVLKHIFEHSSRYRLWENKPQAQ